MRLMRFALMILSHGTQSVRRWGYTTRDGVNVSIVGVKNAKEPNDSDQQGGGPTFLLPGLFAEGSSTEILLGAEIDTECERLGTTQVLISGESREAAERAISEMAVVLGIQAEQPWRVVSPMPYLALIAETGEDRKFLDESERIVLPSPALRPVMMGTGLGEPQSLAELLPDRPDGLMLLGAATRAGGGIAKLHELFRLFESGFGRGGLSLLDPLTLFLRSYPEWELGYSREEVRFWIEHLRHPATHADLRRSKKLVFDADVDRHVPRIEQAAYDVFFNKEKWHSGDHRRQMRWALQGGRVMDGPTLTTPKARLPMAGPLDHFGTFPLNERYELNADFGETTHLWARWYYSDEDWARFEKEVPGQSEL